jgi:hypothetical protein
MPWPITIVDGFTAPEVQGKPGYYTNKSGDIINFPNAYQRAWGKPIYHQSTARVEVGVGWLLANGLS